jgi:phosphatidylinositol-3-phosphatase
MLRRRRAVAAASALVAAAALVASSLGVTSVASAATRTETTTPPPSPCGFLAYNSSQPPTYQHVVVIMDENLSYANFVASTQATYLHGLAAACGSETDLHAATHPSQPNYMALTSGFATGVGVHTANDNVFHQLQAKGKTWRSYSESMPSNCAKQTAAAPNYKTGHTPAFWYANLVKPSKTCAKYDVPLAPALATAISKDNLPAYSWITPNDCDDMHWLATCSFPTSSRVAAGDDWLEALVPQLTAMPSYQAGKTLIIVTWDEGDGDDAATSTGVDCTSPAYYPAHPDCQIPTIIVSPYVRPGATDATDHNLYGLLGTTEDILGVPRLGRAKGQPSLRTLLGF